MWPNAQEIEDLLKKSLIENFIFCAVWHPSYISYFMLPLILELNDEPWYVLNILLNTRYATYFYTWKVLIVYMLTLTFS